MCVCVRAYILSYTCQKNILSSFIMVEKIYITCLLRISKGKCCCPVHPCDTNVFTSFLFLVFVLKKK